MKNENEMRVEQLKAEIDAKLEELRKFAHETNTPAQISIDWHTFQVLVPSAFDEEEDYDYVAADYEAGAWISSSALC